MYRRSIEAMRWFNERDWEAYRAGLADVVITRDRRSVSAIDARGPDERIEHLRSMLTVMPDARMESTPIAGAEIPGGHVGVFHGVIHGHWAETGEPAELALLVVNRFEDERLAEDALFEGHEREAALAAFDEMVAERVERPITPFVRQRAIDAMRWFNERDWEAYRAGLADSYESRDRRAVSMVRLEGPDALIENLRGWLDVQADAQLTCTPLAGTEIPGGHVGAFHAAWRGRQIETGDEIEIEYLVVNRFDGELLAYQELFDGHDRAAALAAFDEMVAAAPPAAAETRVARVARTLIDAVNRRDFEALEETLTDDLVFMDVRRASPLGGEEADRATYIERIRLLTEVGTDVSLSLDEIIQSTADTGAGISTWRGRVPEGGEFATPMVNLQRARGEQIELVVVFDPEDRENVQRHFDALATGAPLWVVRWIEEYRRCFNERDWTALRALYATDFSITRWRRFSSPTDDDEGVDGVIEASRSAVAVSPDAVVDVRLVRAACDVPDGGAVVVEFTVSGTYAGGGAAEHGFFSLLRFAERRAITAELFDEESAALARLDELARASDIPAAVHERLDIFLTRINAREWDALHQGWAEDLLYIDDRPGTNAGVCRGRDAMVAQVREVVAMAGDATWDAEVVAGAEFAGDVTVAGWIGRISWEQTRDGAGSGELKPGFVQLVVAGRSVYFRVLDGDDRDTLTAAYEQLRAALAAGFPWWAAIWVAEWVRRTGARDWTSLAELYDPGYRLVSHRQLPWESLDGVDATIANQRSFFENSLTAEARLHPIAGFGDADGGGVMLAEAVIEGTNEAGGEFVFSTFNTGVFRNRRLLLSENFDDEDAARARLEERRRSRADLPPRLAATWERWLTALRTRDWETFADCYAPEGHRVEDHRRLDGQLGGSATGVRSPAEVVELWRARLALTPEVVPEFDVLGTASDRLIHARMRIVSPGSAVAGVGESALELHLITELDHTGRVVWVEMFDPDDIEAARAAFDRLRDRDAAWIAALFAEYERAYNARDWDAAGALLHDEVELEDHRPVGIGRVSGPRAFLDLLPAMIEQAPDLKMSLPVLLSEDHGGGCGIAAVRCTVSGTSVAGGTVEIFHCHTVRLEDGRFREWHMYASEDDARAAFEERRVGDDDRPSFAREWARRLSQAVDARDWDAVRALYADDYHDDDHRQLAWEGHQSAEGFLDTMRSGVAMSADVRLRFDVLATHGNGDGAAAMRVRWDGTNEHGGAFEVAWHNILVFRGGRAAYGERFEDEASALARLDELRARQWIAARFAAYEAAYNARDWDAIGALLHENLEFDDHRRVGMGRVSGVRAFLDVLTPVVAQAPDVLMSFRVILSEESGPGCGAAMARCFVSGTAATGGSVEILHWHAIRFEDGRFRDCHMYATEDEARAAFEELRRDDVDAPAFVLDWARRLPQLIAARDWDALRELYVEGCRTDDRRQLPWAPIEGVDATLDGFRSAVALSPDARVSIDVLAGYGDDEGGGAAATRTRWSATNEHGGEAEIVYYSAATFRRGRQVTTEHFDDEASALARLEELRRHPVELPPRLAAMYERWTSALRARDWDAFATCYAPGGHRFVDHRLLDRQISGTASGAESAQLWRTRLELTPDLVPNLEILEVVGERLVLARIRFESQAAAIPGVGASAIDVLQIGEADEDGRVVLIEYFDPDDEASALARLEELRPSPFAVEWAQRWTHLFNTRDWDAMPEVYTEDYRFDDRRALPWASYEGVDAAIATLRSGIAVSADMWVSLDVVRAHGDDAGSGVAAMTLRLDGTNEHGGAWQIVMHSVFTLREGRLARTEQFDDEASALARLEELRLPPLVATALRRFTAALRDQDWEAMGAVYAPGYRFEDHRGIEGQFGSGSGPASAAERWRSRAGVMGDAGIEVEPIEIASDHAVLVRCSLRSDRPAVAGVGPSAIDALLLGAVDDDGLITQVEWFDPDDLETARAALARVGDADAGWIPALFAEYERAYNARGWDAIEALLHDEFELEDLKPPVEPAPDLRVEITLLAGDEIDEDGRGLAAARADVRGTTEGGGPVEIVHCWAIRFEERRIRRFHVFTSDAEAVERYARWRDALAAGVPWWGLEFAERAERARNERDWSGLAAMFAPDATIEDHRPIGWGTLDPDSLIAMLQSGIELADDAGMEIAPLAGHGDDAGNGALLVYMRGHGTWNTGGPLELVFYGVMRCVAGVSATLDMYGDEPAARARLEALRPA